jgi:hypothetical protein
MARFSLVRALTLQSTHLSVQSTRKIHSLCILYNTMYFLVRSAHHADSVEFHSPGHAPVEPAVFKLMREN